MKTAVLTLTVGELYDRLAKISHPTLAAYAEKIGADFLIHRELDGHKVPGYAKLEAIKAALETYDRLIFVDTDILIRFDAPNLFDLVPPESLGVYHEGGLFDRTPAKRGFAQVFGCGPDFVMSKYYFNTGVMVISKAHAPLFVPAVEEIDNFGEQTMLNYRIFSRKTPVQTLHYKFNRLPIVTPSTGEPVTDCYFLHFAGGFSVDPQIIAQNFIGFEYVAKVFAEWREAGKVPVQTKSFFVQMSGGLGDQVASEPLIRFMAEKLWPGQNLTVQTNWPEILEHLKDKISVLPPNKGIQDTGYYQVYLLPGEGTPPKPSFNKMHPLDYVSVRCIDGQLLKEDRQIKLKGAGTEHDVSQHFLVHPGRGWASKTFPIEWWDAIISGLKKHSGKVALIGTQTVDVNPEGCLDLRGKTSVGELISVIENAPCLITNDSSPIHIAGAFENPAVLIASCKHPDMIFPARSPELNIAMGKQLWAYESFPPNYVGFDVCIDECTPEELAKALPNPADVVRRAIIAYLNRLEVRRGQPNA